MKRILTLTAALIMGAAAFAQNVVFCNADGKEIPNGTTLTFNEAEFNDFEEFIVPLKGLYVKNTTNSQQSFSMTATATLLPEGSGLGCCYGGTCKAAYAQDETMLLNNLSIAPNAMVEITDTEWKPALDENDEMGETYLYGTAKMDFTIAGGSTLHIVFIYAEPSSISSLKGTSSSKAYYTLDGKCLSAPTRGIQIVRSADGTAKKVIR